MDGQIGREVDEMEGCEGDHCEGGSWMGGLFAGARGGVERHVWMGSVCGVDAGLTSVEYRFGRKAGEGEYGVL